jgi:V/A-type H+-transporting ATPase subunit E
MTGLDKIIEKILEQSQMNCNAILNDAALQVKNIISQARETANKQSGEIVAKAEAEAKRIEAVSKSTAESITRNRYLEIRNAILNDIISAAYLEIEKFSDEDYFAMLKRLCIKNVLEGECEMSLSGYDLGRLPDDFEMSINSEIYEKGAVHISNVPGDIENGFVLHYGDIEINCSLKAVFDENMDALKDMLSTALF